MGLSLYLLLVRIYSSAISVAEDSKLRKTILKLAVKETNFSIVLYGADGI
jgi:hypothetical protein